MKIIDGHAMIERVEALQRKGAVDLSYFHIVREAVQMQPAVDAAPVVHGRWKVILNPFWDAECRECGYTKRNGWEWRYCPNCGAKMDKNGKEKQV